MTKMTTLKNMYEGIEWPKSMHEGKMPFCSTQKQYGTSRYIVRAVIL